MYFTFVDFFKTVDEHLNIFENYGLLYVPWWRIKELALLHEAPMVKSFL